MPEPIIRFEDVSKRFADKDGRELPGYAVQGLSFEIAAGELIAVVGRTGCGKSTMFNLLTGLLEPTAGAVRVYGRDPFRDFDWFRGKVAVVFQSDRLLPWRSAVHNVAYGLELNKVGEHERLRIACEWLERLGLKGYEDTYPHALSGGMRQRVSIARAFAVNAEILLCDEPFSSLDELTGAKLRAEFVRLVRENRKTSIFITHSIDEALALGERILVFRPPAYIALQVRPSEAATDAERAAMKDAILAAMTAGSADPVAA
ncbi:MAG: ABC transporter ATP-binding protein [Burkholderiales bacterium]|nr:ABC transporter ATP-binding protein [Burkholderiales bacterium]